MVQGRKCGKRAGGPILAQAIALAAILASLAALLAFRAAYVDARDVATTWATACAGAAPAWPCLPRDALLWLQYWSLWGLAALALGVAAFLTGWFPAAAAAIAFGSMAVANYNATWGVLGAALGLWAWIRPARAKR